MFNQSRCSGGAARPARAETPREPSGRTRGPESPNTSSGPVVRSLADRSARPHNSQPTFRTGDPFRTGWLGVGDQDRVLGQAIAPHGKSTERISGREKQEKNFGRGFTQIHADVAWEFRGRFQNPAGALARSREYTSNIRVHPRESAAKNLPFAKAGSDLTRSAIRSQFRAPGHQPIADPSGSTLSFQDHSQIGDHARAASQPSSSPAHSHRHPVGSQPPRLFATTIGLIVADIAWRALPGTPGPAIKFHVLPDPLMSGASPAASITAIDGAAPADRAHDGGRSDDWAGTAERHDPTSVRVSPPRTMDRRSGSEPGTFSRRGSSGQSRHHNVQIYRFPGKRHSNYQNLTGRPRLLTVS